MAMLTWLVIKLTVEAQLVKAENTFSVDYCIITLGNGLIPHCLAIWYLIAQAFGLDFKLGGS